MAFPKELQTERLHLRPATEADAETIFRRYGQDPQVARYVSWMPHRSLNDTLEFLADGSAIIRKERVLDIDLLAATGELLGAIGGGIMGTRLIFGYCFARDAWGHGFATEAARAYVGLVSDEPGIWRVQALCDLENRASARVLEKAGLALEGILRCYMILPNLGDVPRDVYCYAKVREKAN